VWSAFLLGIAVSLAANIAAASALEWKPVLVAGWHPVALPPRPDADGAAEARCGDASLTALPAG
jgi:hypothetical protein